jgi:hypothetical protein
MWSLDLPDARKLGPSTLAKLLFNLFNPPWHRFVGESNMLRLPRFVIKIRVCRRIVAVFSMKVNGVLN